MAGDHLSYLKLTPTRDSRLTLNDTKELIGYLSELIGKNPFELGVRSKSGNGIELYLAITSQNIASIKSHIYSISPGLSVEKISRSVAAMKKPTLSLYYRFSRHYAFPLYSQEKSTEDNLTSLMQHLSQIDKGQSVEIKLIARGARPLKARLLRNRLLGGASPRLHNPDVIGTLKKSASAVVVGIISVLRSVLYIFKNLAITKRPEPKASGSVKVARAESVMLLDKLYEPLFKTKLSLSIKASSQKQATALAEEILRALNNFAGSSGYQQFRLDKRAKAQDLYSISDLAALYHIAQTESMTDIYKLQTFKALPAASEFLRPKLPGDITLGFNIYQATKTDLTLNSQARQRHLYITGATGSGKSTLLANLIIQDMKSGQGLSLIDPHGDLARDVMKRIPESRLKDVIYFDPTDHNNEISINLLELKSSPGTVDYSREADLVTESIISLFRKVFSAEDNGGHRIEYLLRNTIHTALDIPGSTIFTIFRLLTDSSYRLQIVPSIKDQDLANFWLNELGRAGEYQRVKMSAGVTSKIGRFLFSEPSKRVFGQPGSTLDIARAMDSRQILICNFAKGKLGEDGSRLFSAAMLTKLQLSALNRVERAAEDRADHYLYIDEFQNHAPSSVVQMLSEARKYGLYLTMAEQSPYQQDTQSTNTILANVGNLLCFRTALPKDEGLLMPNFEKYLSSSDLNSLPAYKFYFKSTALEVTKPTSAQSYPLPEIVSNATKLKSKPANHKEHPKNLRLQNAHPR